MDPSIYCCGALSSKGESRTHKIASVPCRLASDPVLHVGSDAANFVLLQSASGPVAHGAYGGAGGEGWRL